MALQAGLIYREVPEIPQRRAVQATGLLLVVALMLCAGGAVKMRTCTSGKLAPGRTDHRTKTRCPVAARRVSGSISARCRRHASGQPPLPPCKTAPLTLKKALRMS